MSYVILGENQWAREQELARLLVGKTPEFYDGNELDLRDLPDIFMGQTLFSTDRTIVITDLSANKIVWEQLEPWLDRLDDTTMLILVETTLDRRTRMYKLLQKRLSIVSADFWKSTQDYEAKRWLEQEASKRSQPLDGMIVSEMIRRATRPGNDGKLIIDQLRLATVLTQLTGLDTVTMQHIDTVMAPDIHENIFALFLAALDGNVARVRSMTQHLASEEDGYKALGLLLSQAVNLAVLSTRGDRSIDQVASDTGASVYGLRPLEPYATGSSRSTIAQIVSTFAAVDARVKRGAEPWSTIETGLQKIALM